MHWNLLERVFMSAHAALKVHVLADVRVLLSISHSCAVMASHAILPAPYSAGLADSSESETLHAY